MRFFSQHWFHLFVLLLATVPGLAAPVEILPPELRGAIQPQVTMAPDGTIYVTFGKETSIYATASIDGGATFSRPVEVGSLPRLALGMRRGPRITASNARVAISAISHEEGNLYAWTSGDHGVTWTKAVTINSTPKSAREGLHAMAGDGRGGLCAVWLDLRNQGMQLWSAASRDDGKTWGENVPVYASPDGHICECCHPSVSVNADGSIQVMWRNWLKESRDMYLASSTDGGKTFGPAKKLGDGTWHLDACPMDGGGLAESYSVWRRKSEIYYTDASATEHQLSAQGRQPVVAMAKDGPYFLWQEESRLMLAKGTNALPVVLSENAAYPSIAASSKNNSEVIAWESTTNGVKTILIRVLTGN